MRYFLYGATLAFAWFLCVNVLMSLLVSLGAGAISDGIRQAAPAARARTLLWLRLLPAASAIFFIGAFFVPSFLRFEPRNFDESFGLAILSLGLLGCSAIVAAIWRGISAVADVRTRLRVCLQQASPFAVGRLKGFRVDGPGVAMTLVGVVRPRLLVTGRLLDILASEEWTAAVAHERSHLRSWDNLKRLAMRSAPDVLALSRVSRRLEKEWAVAAEHAADARAARDTGTRLALASALIKVARSIPGDLAPPVSSPLVGGESLRSRVERLLECGEGGASHARAEPLPRAIGAMLLVGWLFLGLHLAVVLGYQDALTAVHAITEVVVHQLP